MGDCSREADSCGHSHDHDHDTPERGLEYSLYKYIDKDKVSCLNESQDKSGASIFKPHDKMLDTVEYVESDVDDQLLIYIPFTGNVKIKSIKVIGPDDERHPRVLKVYGQRDDIDFDNVDSLSPLQQFDLSPDPCGRLDYVTRASKFQNLRSLTLFLSTNGVGETVKVTYIGLAGEFFQVKSDSIITIYELNANPADHKVKDTWQMHSSVS